MEFVKEFSKCDISAVSTALTKWILEFLGIRGVNSNSKFELGSPKNSQLCQPRF